MCVFPYYMHTIVTPTYICAIDAEKPFIKYVCISLLYAHDCNKHSYDDL